MARLVKLDNERAAFAAAEKQIQNAIERGNAKTLSLTYRHLTELPSSIGQLTGLLELYLGGNKLTTLPRSMARLTQLRKLYLFNNRLAKLPDWLGRLTQLRVLHLGDNQLELLPEAFRHLTFLRELYLHGNDALGLPPEILGGSSQERYSKPASKPTDILDYYFRIRAGKRPLNEAKLILLGRGEVGKTALVNRMVYNKFAATSIRRGIAITQWSVTANKDTVRLHVWDFGGQEIQHATHQFFLTERSLYLIVLNGRAGAEDEDAEYWLKFVKTFGGSSPTIVVMNKIKVQPFQVNRRSLKEKYPFVRAFVETDCKPRMHEGIIELKGEIQSALSSMKHVRADFPADWFQIKERLAKMKKPFISFAEYRGICVKLGERNAKAQERLAGFLDDLGIALNFREDEQLRDETVLNPHWITEGVYRIITSQELADRQGELRLGDLDNLLSKRLYPRRMHEFLIDLMKKFELCFPFHDDPSEHRYLVPELLGKEKPMLNSFLPIECLNFRYEYRLMPEGLLPRFISRTHTMSGVTERWRTGVVLRWEGCRALIEADKQERQVIVRVVGESEKRRRLFSVIRENFDRIHSEMKEFRPTEWVALESHPDRWISYTKLETFEQNRKREFEEDVDSKLVIVDVTQLLDLTDVPGARDRTVLSRDGSRLIIEEKRPLKLFISYAHLDERWRLRLKPNLELLQREGLIEIWSDHQISPGSKWDDEIKRKLEDADLYLFLMSTNLLNSDYVRNRELPAALKRYEEKKAGFVPVVLQRCSWKRYIGEIKALPADGRPVSDWRPYDRAYFDVEEGLRRTIREVRKMLGI